MKTSVKHNGWAVCALVIVALCMAAAFLPWHDSAVKATVGEESTVIISETADLFGTSIKYLDAVTVFSGACLAFLLFGLLTGSKNIIRVFAAVFSIAVLLVVTVFVCGMEDYTSARYAAEEYTVLFPADAQIQLTTDVGMGIFVLPLLTVMLCLCCFKAASDKEELRQPDLRRLCICAMLVAIGVVLSGVLNIPSFSVGIYSMKIGLGSLAAILAGVLYGPFYGGVVGALVDLLQATLFPKGAFVPWFTLVALFSGLIPGLFFTHRKKAPGLLRIGLATLVGQLACSVLANTFLIHWLYGAPLEVLIVPRLINQAIMIPVYTLLIWALVLVLSRTKLLYRFTDYERQEITPVANE